MSPIAGYSRSDYLNGTGTSIPLPKFSFNLDTPENRDALARSGGHAESVADGLASLYEAGLLTPENRDALVASGRRAKSVADGLRWLNRTGLFAPATRP